MNPHDDDKDKKNHQTINEFDEEHPIELDDEDEETEYDLDEEEYDEDDSDEEFDEDEESDEESDKNESKEKSAVARPKPQGRGLRSLAVAEEEEELPPSKTKIKKQMHDLRDLGEELTELGKDQLTQLDIPESLRDAIKDMHRIKSFGAKRRQLQYIGKLMRDVEIDPIIAKLNTWKGTSQQHIGYMHQIERWRERLLEGDVALTELLAAYPDTDVQRLRTLIRNALKEREAGKPGKNFREIFQILRETIPQPV
ncbi:MAG: ribosome biogenesis factor YjgA [Nitrosomonadales bacterium]